MTLQQVYRCAIDPDLFAAKIKQAEKWSAELNTGEVFVKTKTLEGQRSYDLGEWDVDAHTRDGKEIAGQMEHRGIGA